MSQIQSCDGEDDECEGLKDDDDDSARFCEDTANGAKDNMETGCDFYEENREECGNWDDDDFRAEEMCCACRGGNIFDNTADSCECISNGDNLERFCTANYLLGLDDTRRRDLNDDERGK